MSAQDGSWIPVYLLPTRLRHKIAPEYLSTCCQPVSGTRLLLNTCLPAANPSPASLAVATSNRLKIITVKTAAITSGCMSQNSDAIPGSPCLCVPHRCPQLAAEWRLAYRQYSPSWLSAHKIFSAHCYRFEHCRLVFQKNMQFSCALYWTKCAAQNGDCHGFGFT